MLGNVFLNSLKLILWQNASRTFIDDSVYYTIITEGIQDIFYMLNTKKIRWYSFVEETLSADADTDGLVYTSSHKILWFVRESDTTWEDRRTGVETITHTILEKKPFATNRSGEFTMVVDSATKTGAKGIKTHTAHWDLILRYFREPDPFTQDTLTTELDLPNGLTGALRIYCMMELLPFAFLDTGANLSQFYYNRYKERLQSYASVIGSDIDFTFTHK